MRMLIYVALLCLLVINQSFAVPLTGNDKRVVLVESLSTWYGAQVAASLAVPGIAKPTIYNIVILGFIHNYGALAAAQTWEHPFYSMDKNHNPYGNTEEEVRQSWVNSYHQAGIKVLASAFGPYEQPTTSGIDVNLYCDKIANFVKDNNLDGVDLNYLDAEAFAEGTAEDWLITCTKVIREILPLGQYLLTHGPNATYFAVQAWQSGGYLKIHQEVGDLIDWYNILYFNAGYSTYDSYESLFLNSYWMTKGSSVNEIMIQGIPKEKIVIGKPVSRRDNHGQGFVSASDLNIWSEQAGREIGWNTGIMTYAYQHDQSGEFIQTYMSG